ncbi:MAG: class I SAM-dependent methyltransferase [Mariniphaga sp.]
MIRRITGAIFHSLNEWKRRRSLERKFSHMSTQEIYSKIYKENIWGQDHTGFFSGGGSSSPNVSKYIDFVDSFIRTNNITRVVDLGCGDFRVMRTITDRNKTLNYIGVDIVPDLISFVQNHYGNERIQFLCLDAIKDNLPDADLVTVRQVLQHLSNHDVTSILKKLVKYKYALVSEHILTGPGVIPNKDKKTGQFTRLDLNSSLLINLSPFSLDATQVFEYDENYGDKSAVIRTYLLQNNSVVF